MKRDRSAEVSPAELEPATLQESLEVGRAMAKGIAQAQSANRRAGLPNVVTRGGHLVEEFPDGSFRVVEPSVDDTTPVPHHPLVK